MAAILEPIITTSHFLSIPDALWWYQNHIHPDTTKRDIEITVEEGGIEISKPNPKARYNLTAPEGRWQYELDEFWKCLEVVSSDCEILPELLQHAWYDHVEPFGKAAHIDYKQYTFVRVTYHTFEEIFEIDFFTEEMTDGPCICIHSASTDETCLAFDEAQIRLDF